MSAVADPPVQHTEITSDFGNWLAGFIDGEGCFVIDRRDRGVRHTYGCRLTVVLRDDDRQILDEIHARTGLGVVAPKAAQVREGRNGSPQYGWHVRDKAGCVALVDLLDRYPLRARKALDYAIWREAALIWGATTYRGSRPEDRLEWERIGTLFHQLRDVRRYR